MFLFHLGNLTIPISLQPQTLPWRQPADSAVVNHSMTVSCRNGEHWLFRFFHPSSILADFFLGRCQHCPWRFFHQHPGTFASVVMDAGILSGIQTSCNVCHQRRRGDIYKCSVPCWFPVVRVWAISCPTLPLRLLIPGYPRSMLSPS